MSVFLVCLFVCLSARVTRDPHCRTLPIFLCMLPMAVARSSSRGVAIRHTSGFVNDVIFSHNVLYGEESMIIVNISQITFRVAGLVR